MSYLSFSKIKYIVWKGANHLKTAFTMNGRHANAVTTSGKCGHFLRSSVRKPNKATPVLAKTALPMTEKEMDTEDFFLSTRDEGICQHQSTSECVSKKNSSAHIAEDSRRRRVSRRINGTYRADKTTMRSGKFTKKKYTLTKDQAQTIRKVIQRHAPRLMKKHKNLSVISGGVRLQTVAEKIKPVPVIVMYVRGKDEILPEQLGDFPVVVEEGGFQTSVSAADEFQEKLRLGCQITSNINNGEVGTLGGFIEHPEYGLCGLSCAHVLLNKETLHGQRRRSRKKWEDADNFVYQPTVLRPNNRIGVLRETIYKSGGNGKSGVDLALFQIQDRPPDSGEFPEGAEGMLYDSGRIIGKPQLNVYNASVWKFGRTTSKTDGFVEFCGAAIKMIEFNANNKEVGSNYTYTLFDQIEIRPVLGQCLFSDAGDSGALVFKENVSKEVACVGMVVGNITDGSGRRRNSIVTPVSAIMDELGISEFKNFVWSRIDSMKTRFNKIDNQLKKLDDMDTSIKNMEKTLEVIEKRLKST